MSDEFPDDWELSPEWKEEILRRAKEVEEGKVKLIPAEEVFRQCRETLRRKTYGYYDQSYFDGGPESSGYSSYTDSWIWSPITELILYFFDHPTSVLDWGCAKGYLICRLVERGVDAHGIEVSRYAKAQCPEAVKTRIALVEEPVAPLRDDSVDVVCSFETLEHISKHDVPQVLSEMARVGRKWFFGSIFLEGMQSGDPTHICVQTREWWDERFAEAGWVPVLEIAEEASKFPVFQALGYQLFCYKLVE